MSERRSLWSGLVRLAVMLAVPVLVVGCKNFAVGEVNQIVVSVPDELRDALGAELRSALEPREFTVRDEALFDVAYVDPGEPEWTRLRLMRHILLVGSAADPLVAEALATSRRGDQFEPPVVIQLSNVWAKRQVVTVALLPPDADQAEVSNLLRSAGRLYRSQFGDLVRARTSLAGTRKITRLSARRDVGFTISLPASYQREEPELDVVAFRDEEPSQSAPVIRVITVDSRAPDEVEWSARGARAWRAELGNRLNQPPQVTEALATARQGLRSGRRVVEIQGVWSNPKGEWPAAGPFVTHLVECPERVFLIDAWLYAPAADKFELLFRLNRILETFRCADPAIVA